MRRVPDDGLVEVAHLDGDVSFGIGERTQVAKVAVSADPDRRALGQGAAWQAVEPLVELEGIAADVGMGGPGHLQGSLPLKHRRAFLGAEGSGLGHSPPYARTAAAPSWPLSSTHENRWATCVVSSSAWINGTGSACGMHAEADVLSRPMSAATSVRSASGHHERRRQHDPADPHQGP